MAAEDLGARAAAADLIDAFNQADWERFRSRVTDDVVYEETGTGRRVDGAGTYVELCQGWRRAR
jgi:ketosteroid isomerase-like protein